MSDAEKTDPNWKTRTAEANKKADPIADRLLYKIQRSEYSAVIIVVLVLALIGFGLWISR